LHWHSPLLRQRLSNIYIKKGAVEMKKALQFLKSENGQGMVEYGLIIGLISVAAITVIIAFGPHIVNIFTKAGNALTSADT
jgi:pilus assembly protein Flp/PilA